MNKQVRVKLGYGRLSNEEVATEAVAAIDGLTNNPKFPNPPVSLADVKAQVETFASLIAAANDGGNKAIVERNKQRAVVVKMLRQLGHWVEANCGDDPAILKSSGFQQAATARTPAQPLDGPPSFKVENGPNSGQAIVRGKPVLNAVGYGVRFAPLGPDGKPVTWVELHPSTTIRAIPVTGLTPATTYVFQVRALGRQGYTDWSDSITRIAM
jgi:hypothetical protein